MTDKKVSHPLAGLMSWVFPKRSTNCSVLFFNSEGFVVVGGAEAGC